MEVVRREDQEAREHELLSEGAAFSDETEGRARSTEPDYLRNEYQRDRDKILHTKSFRRLSHKTQVFLAVEGDHYRTRLTHTLEVSQIARTVSRALGLNEDLHRGHRPGTRFGAHALRAHRRRGHRAAHSLLSGRFCPGVCRPRRRRPGGHAVPPQRAEPARGRGDRERRARAQPYARGAKRHLVPFGQPARRNARRARSRRFRPDRLREPRHRRRPARGRFEGIRLAGFDPPPFGASNHSERIETLVSDLVETTRPIWATSRKATSSAEP